MDIKNLSSNWKQLQAHLKPANAAAAERTTVAQLHNGTKRRRHATSTSPPEFKRIKPQQSPRIPRSRIGHMASAGEDDVVDSKSFVVQKDLSNEDNSCGAAGDRINEGLCSFVEVGKFVAVDCEMVGIGPDPSRESALARVSLVNYNGEQIYDSYVKPREPVTDWRTHVSGITPRHMLHARSLEEVQLAVANIMKDKIVVGHSVRGDFDALLLSHPRKDIRDTARHGPYRKLAGGGSPKLKILVSELLGLDIQSGEHSSIEDARATMLLFRRDKDAFEREHSKKWPVRIAPRDESNGQWEEGELGKSKPKKKKKKKR